MSLIPHSDLGRGRRGVLLVNLLLVVLMSRVSLSVCNVVGGGCLTSVPRVVFCGRWIGEGGPLKFTPYIMYPWCRVSLSSSDMGEIGVGGLPKVPLRPS